MAKTSTKTDIKFLKGRLPGTDLTMIVRADRTDSIEKLKGKGWKFAPAKVQGQK